MIDIKTTEEIKNMTTGGEILAEVLWEVLDAITPGITEIELDSLAEKRILEKGGEPGFKKVKGYKHSICVSTNDVVVHGVPSNYVIRAGDVVGIDCGVYYKGLHTDMSETLRVKKAHQAQKNKKDAIDTFLETGKKALAEGIKQAKAGARVGNISKTIQNIVEGNGYSVVRSLVGHGVGKSLHEEPEVPGFLRGSIEKTPQLREGMTIAIEVIYNLGKPDVVYSGNDGWTIRTKDGSLSGVFERTVLVTESGPVVLTR